MNSRYIVSRNWESTIFALRRPKWLLHTSVRANQQKKIFLSTQRTSSLESGNQRFWTQQAEMTLTPISSLESARKKCSWTRGTSCLESGNQTFLGSGGRNHSNNLSVCANQREKKIFLDDSRNWLVLESFRPPEPKDVWFPLSRHNVPRLHEKFFLADSSELVGVRVISASRAQKVWYPLSRHHVRRVHKKNFLSPIRANWWVLESFRPPEPKNVLLLLSRHDVRRFHEKFFLAHSSELMPVESFRSLEPKTFIPTF